MQDANNQDCILHPLEGMHECQAKISKISP